MKGIALTTLLAMAIPAAAYAQPVSPDQRTYDRDRDGGQDRDRDRDRDRGDSFRRDHYDRFANTRWSNEHGRWATLARANSASGRREFMVGNTTRYHTFRLEALRGDPMISKIAINFANGQTQVVQLNSTLPAGAGEVIDLQGNDRRVLRIVVYADPRSRGTYAIYGT
ncbi:MAG TPA: hypothetical protein VGD37_03230 [Kofleriaceae bacterium]|jgi:Ni/Co efflux regulator RcnB